MLQFWRKRTAFSWLRQFLVVSNKLAHTEMEYHMSIGDAIEYNFGTYICEGIYICGTS